MRRAVPALVLAALALMLAGCGGGKFLDGVDDVTPAQYSTDDTKQLHNARLYCSIQDSGQSAEDGAVKVAAGTPIDVDELRAYVRFALDHCDEVYELTGGKAA